MGSDDTAEPKPVPQLVLLTPIRDAFDQMLADAIERVNRQYREEASAMYVYIQSETYLWTVGFYDPSGEWHPESDHDSKESAAARVIELNGGRRDGS